MIYKRFVKTPWLTATDRSLRERGGGLLDLLEALSDRNWHGAANGSTCRACGITRIEQCREYAIAPASFAAYWDKVAEGANTSTETTALAQTAQEDMLGQTAEDGEPQVERPDAERRMIR
jgi:hypothetical protein